MKVRITTRNGDDFMYELPKVPYEVGGEGKIYPIYSKRYGECFLKIYIKNNKAKDNEKKVKYLVSTTIPFEHKNIRYCWPIGIVRYEDGTFCGFIMESAIEKSVSLTILSDYSIAEDLSKIYPEDLRWHKLYELNSQEGLRNRLIVLKNIAKAINGLHKTGLYCLVDLKPENILITCGGKISIIDIDSIQIKTSNHFFKSTAFTPNYLPAEAYEKREKDIPLNTDSDVFAFACCAYMILTGTHPYTNVILKNPYNYEEYNLISSRIKAGLYLRGSKSAYISHVSPQFDLHKNYDRLPECIQLLFDKSFNNTKRPSMKDWIKGLNEGKKQIQL